jgi:hypothetical protein
MEELSEHDFQSPSAGFSVPPENQNVRVDGLRPLRPFSASSAFLFFPVFMLIRREG